MSWMYLGRDYLRLRAWGSVTGAATHQQRAQQAVRVRDLLTMIREMLGNRIEIEYRTLDDPRGNCATDWHYQITPYSFRSRIARRLTKQTHLDLGQGLLDLLEEVAAGVHSGSGAAGA